MGAWEQQDGGTVVGLEERNPYGQHEGEGGEWGGFGEGGWELVAGGVRRLQWSTAFTRTHNYSSLFYQN